MVIWLDTSIRITKPLDVVVAQAVERGGLYLPHAGDVPQAAATHPGVYRYLPTHSLEEETVTPQKGTGFIIAINSEAIYWKILHWWYLCALEVNCIAPPGHNRNCAGWQRCVRNNTAICWSKCHRYEQSAINVLFSNYLHEIKQNDGLLPKNNRPFKVTRHKTHWFRLFSGKCNRRKKQNVTQ